MGGGGGGVRGRGQIYSNSWGVELVGVAKFRSKVKVNFWPRSRVKAENGGSKFLTPVAGGSTESM